MNKLRLLRKTRNDVGFTLIELLVSISIIAIISAIASMSFSVAQKKARDSRRIQDMSSLQKAAEQYYTFTSYKYPASAGKWTSGNGEVVLDVFPSEPKGVGWTAYSSVFDATTFKTYCICAALEYPVGNANVDDCSAFVATGGSFYCVKDQQ